MRKLEDHQVDVKLKLSAFWTSFMFLSIYVDYFHLYMPGSLQGLLDGRVFAFDVNPLFLAVVLVPTTLSSVMIVLSLVLPARINRWANMVIGVLFIPYMTFNLAGEAWPHMVIAVLVENLLLLSAVLSAWRWPEGRSA